jgi:tetratricopeptide (TPR) repeat protein
MQQAAPSTDTRPAPPAGQTKPKAKPAPTPAAPRGESVRALLELARRQSKEVGQRRALATLEKARALAPNSEEVLHAYAEAKLAVDGPLAALPALEALARICPSVGQYHYLHGTALVRAGDVEAALVPLAEAARLEPEEPVLLTALGSALALRGRYAEAKPPLVKALSYAPDAAEALAALAHAEAGLAEWEPAEVHAQRALARAPGDATANLALGLVRLHQERHAEAQGALREAAAGDLLAAVAHEKLAAALAALGDAPGAEHARGLARSRAAEAQARTDRVRNVTGFVPEGALP